MLRTRQTIALLLLIGVLLLSSAPHILRSQGDQHCFPETGYCIAGRIREFWEQNGGLPVFGFPISPQKQETIEGQALQVQWFERNRLELHPENAPPYDVLIGRVGVDMLEQQGRNWHTFPKEEPRQGCLFFEATGHTLCGDMLRYWRSHGLELDGQPGTSEAESLALFGQPISEVRQENLGGDLFKVQWFERARFERHPENDPPYNVLLGLLGEALYTSGPAPVLTATLTPTPTPEDTPTPTLTPTPPPPPTPTVPADITNADLIVDNGAPAFRTSGTWYANAHDHSYNGTYLWAPRGIGNTATIQPDLSHPGAYELFAWWPGDVEFNQSRQALITISPSVEEGAVYSVRVNLQKNAATWNSLGIYYLEPGAEVRIVSGLDGNVIADALRFVYRDTAPIIVTPTPMPTPPTPSLLPTAVERRVVNDFSTRLGIVQSPLYEHTPGYSEQATFDDCTVFPREGCTGTVKGWQVTINYLNMVITYYVNEALDLIAIENPGDFAGRQLLYLSGTQGDKTFLVYRYFIDDTWHLVQQDTDTPTQNPLDPETIEIIRSLSQRYSTVTTTTPNNIELTLYGLGARVQLSPEDHERLAILSQQLAPSW